MKKHRISAVIVFIVIMFGMLAFTMSAVSFSPKVSTSDRKNIANTMKSINVGSLQKVQTNIIVSTPKENLTLITTGIKPENGINNINSQKIATDVTTISKYTANIQNLNTLTSNNALPTISLISPANNSYLQSRNGAQKVINFSITDPNGISQVWYYWDKAGSNTTLSSNPFYIIYLPITEMKHVLYIYANNTLDNVTNEKYVFTTDNTAPIMSFCDPYNISNCNYNPNGTVYNSHMGPTWLTVNVNGTPAYNWIFHWDNAVSNTSFYFNTSSGTDNVLAPYGDGRHTLYLYDEDYAGNWGILVGWFITDNTPPTITLKSPTNNTLQNPGTSIALSLTDTNGFASSCSSFSYYCPKYHWDTDIGNTTLDPAYNTTLLPVSPGQHILHVYAVDIVGNWANTTFVFTTTGPSPSITLSSPTNNTVHKSGTNISLSITGNFISTILYHWDSSANSVFTGTSSYTIPLIAGDGIHTLYIYANNTAGNATSKIFVFTTDDTPPTINLLSPANDTVHHSGTIISFNVIDNTGGGGIGTVLYYWNSAPVYSVLNSPYDLSLPIGNGEHILFITANDTLGNVASPEIYIFYTDDTVPSITLMGFNNDTAHHSGTTISLDITSNNGISVVIYHWDNGVNITLDGSYNVNLPTGEGIHVLYIYTNNTVNTWISSSFVFITDDTPPIITVTTPANGTTVVLQKNNMPSVTVSITDINGIAQILYHWNTDTNTTAPTNLASIEFSYQTTGQEILYIYAEDSTGNWAKAIYVYTIQSSSTSPNSNPSTPNSNPSSPNSNPASLISNASTPGFSILVLWIPLILLSIIVLFKRYRKD